MKRGNFNSRERTSIRPCAHLNKQKASTRVISQQSFMWGYAFSIQHKRDMAVEKFRHVVKQGPNTQEAKDSAKWLDLLKEPLLDRDRSLRHWKRCQGTCHDA